MTLLKITFTEAKGTVSSALKIVGSRVRWTVRKSKLGELFATQSEMDCMNPVLMEPYGFEKARGRGPVPLCWIGVRFGPPAVSRPTERRLRKALALLGSFPSDE